VPGNGQQERADLGETPKDGDASCERDNSGKMVTLRIGNWTLQQVYREPNVYVIDDFLTCQDLEYLTGRIRTGSFRKSFVERSTSTSFFLSSASSSTDDGGEEEIEEGKEEGSLTLMNESGLDGRHRPTSSKQKTKKQKRNLGTSPSSSSFVDRRHRTSTFLSFEKRQDSRVASIEQRAAELLGCWTSGPVEPLQLVRYGPGQVRTLARSTACNHFKGESLSSGRACECACGSFVKLVSV
jgi:hypothetical protein